MTYWIVTLSPLQPHAQVDRAADQPCTPKPVAAAANDPNHCYSGGQSADQHATVVKPKQYEMAIINVNTDNDSVVVSSEHNRYNMKLECSGCHSSVDNKDAIQCCLRRKEMYCMPCLLQQKEHEIHWSWLHSAKTLQEYIDNPIEKYDNG